MSSYVLVRGWIECDFKDVPTIKKLVAGSWASFGQHGLKSDVADLYWNGWSFPGVPINWVAFVFYGGVINSQAYDFFKSVLDEVAKANVEVEGVFYVDFEEADDSRVLRVESGFLLEKKR